MSHIATVEPLKRLETGSRPGTSRKSVRTVPVRKPVRFEPRVRSQLADYFDMYDGVNRLN